MILEEISEITELKDKKCAHIHLKRKDMQTVECQDCRAGWIDNGMWKIEEGKIAEHK